MVQTRWFDSEVDVLARCGDEQVICFSFWFSAGFCMPFPSAFLRDVLIASYATSTSTSSLKHPNYFFSCSANSRGTSFRFLSTESNLHGVKHFSILYWPFGPLYSRCRWRVASSPFWKRSNAEQLQRKRFRRLWMSSPDLSPSLALCRRINHRCHLSIYKRVLNMPCT